MQNFALPKAARVMVALCAFTAVPSHGQTFTTLASFNPNAGSYDVNPGLVQGVNGNFYGTSLYGVHNNGNGTVFEATPSGIITTIYNFCSQKNCSDGATPPSGMTLAGNGNLYGTTSQSGSGVIGYGTVFEISPEGKLKTLYRFCAQVDCSDGSSPGAGVVEGMDGNFYGTTAYGGTGDGGTVFVMSPEGKLTTLHSFCVQQSCSDGYRPLANLVQGANGNFYGTNAYGGAAYHFDKAGTVFEITPAGQFTTLYNFCSQKDCADGKLPGGMIQASNGNLYGFTTKGGRHAGSGCGQDGCGTIFQVTPEGTLTTVISFDVAEGSYPTSLLQATDGNLYGTTAYGGANGYGTIFELTPAGALTLLHSFDSADGRNPASLVQATDGNFYGTSNGGGTVGWGTFFSLSVGLTP